MLLVGFGWLNILSASLSGEVTSYLDFSQPYGKQLIFIIFSFALIILIFSIEAKFYERFASIIYLVSMLSLIGLFFFGKTVSGATSWYAIGGMTIQPSEFAKVATALAVAKYISDLQTNIKSVKDQLKTVLIISIPAVLILLQNDAGSTIVYASFFFVFYREGIPQIYLLIGFPLLIIGVSSLKFLALPTSIVVTVLIFIHHFFIKKKKRTILNPIAIALTCAILLLESNFFTVIFFNLISKIELVYGYV